MAAAAAAGLAGQVRRLVVLGGWAATDLRMRVQFDLWQALAAPTARSLPACCCSTVSPSASSPPATRRWSRPCWRAATGLAPGSDRQAALDAIVDIRACLPAVRAATLVIGLAQDRRCRRRIAARWHRPCPARATKRSIAGTVMLEQPERLLERIERHLEERHD